MTKQDPLGLQPDDSSAWDDIRYIGGNIIGLTPAGELIRLIRGCQDNKLTCGMAAAGMLPGFGEMRGLLRTTRSARGRDGLLPGLPSSASRPLGLGSTGRAVPENLTEQLAMTEVRSAPSGQVLRAVTMTDPRWPASDGWVKMQQIVNGVNIHYVRNTVTGAVDDFKFVTRQ